MDAAQADLSTLGSGVDVRAPDPTRDAIDGVVPGSIVRPKTPGAVGEALRWAADRRLSVVLRGSGTKIEWGTPPVRVDLVLDTTGLAAIVAHEPGDLTVSVEAGIQIGRLNAMLAGHGQCLPLDSSGGDAATIGGLLATNDSGPLRHRFGTPRDLVIGIQVATVDGRLAKAGGRVVKNVAGYDLSRLMCGSFGELAAIVGATFKLAPVPVSSATVVAERVDATAAGAIAAAIAASQLEPQAFEVHAVFGEPAPSIACLVRFASFGAALDSQVAAAQALLTPLAPAVHVEAREADAARWREYPASFRAAPGAIVRASWLPADLSRAVALLQNLGAQGPLELAGRAAIGAGTVRIGGDAVRQASVVGALRESGVFGNVVVLRADVALKAAVDVWGPRQNRALLQAVKRAVDPGNTLGAGRGAV